MGRKEERFNGCYNLCISQILHLKKRMQILLLGFWGIGGDQVLLLYRQFLETSIDLVFFFFFNFIVSGNLHTKIKGQGFCIEAIQTLKGEHFSLRFLYMIFQFHILI